MFQLTTSRRGRPSLAPIVSYILCFNSRPHEEVDSRPDNLSTVPVGRFNSRPHEEVDQGQTLVVFDLVKFQLTTSRRGRPVANDGL